MLEAGSESFVGQFPVPIRHGMTIGELARCSTSASASARSRSRDDGRLDATDVLGRRPALPWVMPSPNIPTLDSAIVYPGTVLFEGTNALRGTRHHAAVRADRRAVGEGGALRGRTERAAVCPASTSAPRSSSRRSRSTRASRAEAARFTSWIEPLSAGAHRHGGDRRDARGRSGGVRVEAAALRIRTPRDPIDILSGSPAFRAAIDRGDRAEQIRRALAPPDAPSEHAERHLLYRWHRACLEAWSFNAPSASGHRRSACCTRSSIPTISRSGGRCRAR